MSALLKALGIIFLIVAVYAGTQCLAKTVFDKEFYEDPFQLGSAILSGNSTIRMSVEGHFTLVHVLLDSKEFTFVLDTGSPVTVVSKRLVNDLELVPYRSTFVSTKQFSGHVPLVQLDDVSLGDVSVQGISAMILPLRELDRLFTQPIDGILGTNFLRHFTVSFDYASRQITFTQDVSAFTQPFLLEDDVPTLIGKINGEDVPVLLDNNAQFAFTSIEDISSLQIGSLDLTYLGAKSGADTQLGFPFFLDHQITLDYPGQRVSILPLPRLEFLSTGLQVDKTVNFVHVTHVDKGSLADNLGIGVGDRILSVNSRDALEFAVMELYGLLHYNNSDVTLVVRNQSDERIVTFTQIS